MEYFLKQVLIVLNPVSGKGKALKLLPAVKDYLAQNSIPFELYKTEEKDTILKLQAEFLAQAPDTMLLVMGGDGTLNKVVNALGNRKDLPIMILPAGSGNDFSSHIYPECSSLEILGYLKKPKLKPVDVWTCNRHRFVNGLGIGFDGWVANRATGSLPWIPASLKYHLAIFAGLFFYKSFECNFGRSLILALSNGQTYGGGFKIAPGADLSDGKLEFWRIKPIPFWKRPIYLSKIKRGIHANVVGPYEVLKISEISIELKEPIDAHLDGEYFISRTFNIKQDLNLNFVVVKA
ncbi:MAG: hypothetical protein H6605_09180 [Flavobacteriales bacterium]|nr:hypothetical protein [Flavobacteriales bacterium]